MITAIMARKNMLYQQDREMFLCFYLQPSHPMTPSTPRSAISSVFVWFLKGLTVGFSLCIIAIVALTGYWTYSDYTPTTIPHVASGDHLSDTKWNQVIDIVNNLQGVVSDIDGQVMAPVPAIIPTNTNCMTQPGGTWWIVCINPLTGKWYYDHDAYSMIQQGPYTSYPPSLQSTHTVCKAWWPEIACINPDNGDLAWISNSSSYWNYKKLSDMYPFQGNNNVQCTIVQWVSAVCVDPTSGDWAYVDSSYTKWTEVRHMEDLYSFSYSSDKLQCSPGWANIICVDPTTGEWAYDSSGAAKWTDQQPTGYPNDFTNDTDVVCTTTWANVVCTSPHSGIMAWISSGSKTWSTNIPANYPFADSTGIRCDKVGWVNILCVDPATGIFTYASSGDKTWTVKDFSASYPLNFINNPNVKCYNIGAWQIECVNTATGEWTFTSTSYT